jgi:hypothetical protein
LEKGEENEELEVRTQGIGSEEGLKELNMGS